MLFFCRKSAAQDLLEAFRQTCITEEDVSSLISIIDKLADDTGMDKLFGYIYYNFLSTRTHIL